MWCAWGVHLLFQLVLDLLLVLGFHLPSAHSLPHRGNDSCPDSHKAFMSIQRQVSLFDGFFKVKVPPDGQWGRGVERFGLNHTLIH